jgi:hypothetical protein
MTRREEEALPTLLGLCLGALAAVVLMAFLGTAQHRDQQDAEKLRDQIAKKVSNAPYVELDRQARRMVAYDEIKK